VFSDRNGKEDVLKSPMYALPVSLNASEKPQKNHWKETMPTETNAVHIMDRAFFLLSRPE
jgi:hypothetical protein